MSLHGPAGACIPVASVSPIYVPPVERVLKHCGAHKHIYINIKFNTHVCEIIVSECILTFSTMLLPCNLYSKVECYLLVNKTLNTDSLAMC